MSSGGAQSEPVFGRVIVIQGACSARAGADNGTHAILSRARRSFSRPMGYSHAPVVEFLFFMSVSRTSIGSKTSLAGNVNTLHAVGVSQLVFDDL